MTKSPENPSALKHLFGRAHLKRLAIAFLDVLPAFPVREFRDLESQLLQLEMKDRVRLIRDHLRLYLPQKYPQALNAILHAVENADLRGFDLWPVTEFVQTYGLECHDLSLAVLRKLTPRFTAEWAVRPFIRLYPKQTLKFLLECAGDGDEHVRRWASEGSRPRLPWGERLHAFVKDPRPALPILERLKFDRALYVRKSVANHLNDIAKDHPEMVVQLLGRWHKEARKEEPSIQAQVDWIIRRSLRTLIKEGVSDALALIGVSHQARVSVSTLTLSSRRIKMGQAIEFSFSVRSRAAVEQALVIDYQVYFVREGGELAKKIFKLKNIKLGPGERLEIKKRHAFKPITTRRYYSGKHRINVQINGRVFAGAQFDLQVKAAREISTRLGITELGLKRI